MIDQYRVERDAAGEIVSDPNRPDDEEYIVRLVGQVVAVSVETLRLVGRLPDLGLDAAGKKQPEPKEQEPYYPQAEADAGHYYFTAKEDPPAND